MALTLTNSNYDGTVLENLYMVPVVGNQVIEKDATALITDVSGKKSLPKLDITEDPLGAYTDDVPVTDTATVAYSERELDMNKTTVYQKFVPSEFHGTIWEKWQSVGDFTNLELNQELLTSILAMYNKAIGRQMAKLFWQGDKTSGTPALAYINGIVTRLIADANAIKPTPAGDITTSSFVDILAACWNAIPDALIDDPNFVFHVNTTDWKTMQTGNTALKDAFVGVFGMSMETMYNTNRIKHFSGMPRHHIVGAVATGNEMESNLVQGVWMPADAETVVIDKVAAGSKTWFLRLDFKLDANYRNASDIVLYTPE